MSWVELLVFKGFYKKTNLKVRKFLDFFSFIYIFQTIEIFFLIFLVLFLFKYLSNLKLKF